MEKSSDRERVLERIRNLLVEDFGCDAEDVKPEARFIVELNLDSLDVVQFILELEDQFAIEIPDDDAERLFTVADAINYAAERMAA